jgi:tetratricopeptide (TPR) repeat protein
MTNERDILDECRRLGKEERHEDAINRLSQVIAVAPSHQLYHQRGMHYERLGKFDMALADFSSALLREPNEPSYLESRGVLLSSRLGRVADALSDFSRAASVSPSSPVPHQHLTLCHLQLGNIDAACGHADRAIELDATDPYSHYCLGQCRLAEERFHSAAEQFEIALQSDPHCARSWAGLCDARLGTGQIQRAQECCEKVINLEPSGRGYIRLARIQLDLANPSGAIDSLKSAMTGDLSSVEKTLVDGYLEQARQNL